MAGKAKTDWRARTAEKERRMNAVVMVFVKPSDDDGENIRVTLRMDGKVRKSYFDSRGPVVRVIAEDIGPEKWDRFEALAIERGYRRVLPSSGDWAVKQPERLYNELRATMRASGSRTPEAIYQTAQDLIDRLEAAGHTV